MKKKMLPKGFDILSPKDSIKQTAIEKEYNPNIPDDLYVIENLGIGGIIIWQDSEGNIYQTRYKSKPEKIASSLGEYLKEKR